jgi:hypothetical protein
VITRTRARSTDGFALTAFAIAGAVDIAYALLIRAQGSSLLDARVVFVSLFIAAAAALAAVAAFAADGNARLLCGAAATGGLIGAGVIGIWSIGLPLLVAGIFAALAWSRAKKNHRVSSAERLLSVGAAIAAPTILVAGIALT